MSDIVHALYKRIQKMTPSRLEDAYLMDVAGQEIKRLRKLLDRIVTRNPDGSVAIRITHDAPSVQAATKMGECGGGNDEGERAAFEAWVRGHCWLLSAEWDGSNYRGASEKDGLVCLAATRTRMMWAAWRDRAALARGEQAKDACK